MKKAASKIGLLFLLISISTNLYAQEQKSLNWNGYIQTRLSSDFDKSNELTVRRAKLWINGSVPDVSWMSYKVQAVYRSTKDANIMLQDAFADMRITNIGSVRVGRFVPDFILQRMQPDYEIPDLERADVVNSIVFNPKTMARQIGAQMTFDNQKSPFRLSMGIFNENQDTPGEAENQNLLFTTHAQMAFVKSNDILVSTGASFGYRYVEALSMASIYNADTLITGNDLRFGVESQLQLKKFGLQAEYIQANIKSDKVWGYYIGADYVFTKTFQATAGLEKYADLISDTNNNPWFGFGGNYFFTEKTKLMTEIKSQKEGSRYNYQMEFQLQIFFN